MSLVVVQILVVDCSQLFMQDVTDTFREQLVVERQMAASWQQVGAEAVGQLADTHLRHHAAATVQRHHREAERRRQVRELGFAHRTASQSQVDRQLREAAARTAAALVVQRFLRHRRQRLEASALRAAHRAKTDLVVSRTSSMHVAAARIQRSHRQSYARRDMRRLGDRFRLRVADEQRSAAAALAQERENAAEKLAQEQEDAASVLGGERNEAATALARERNDAAAMLLAREMSAAAALSAAAMEHAVETIARAAALQVQTEQHRGEMAHHRQRTAEEQHQQHAVWMHTLEQHQAEAAAILEEERLVCSISIEREQLASAAQHAAAAIIQRQLRRRQSQQLLAAVAGRYRTRVRGLGEVMEDQQAEADRNLVETVATFRLRRDNENRAAAAELSAHQHAAAEERLNLLVEHTVEQAVEAAVSDAKLWQRTESALKELQQQENCSADRLQHALTKCAAQHSAAAVIQRQLKRRRSQQLLAAVGMQHRVRAQVTLCHFPNVHSVALEATPFFGGDFSSCFFRSPQPLGSL